MKIIVIGHGMVGHKLLGMPGTRINRLRKAECVYSAPASFLKVWGRVVLGPVDFTALLILALVFIPLEYLFPLRRQQKFFRKNWLNDLVTMLANAVVITFGLIAVITAIGALVRLAIPADFFALVRAQPLWLQVVEVVILADLGFYLAHRAFHAVPFFGASMPCITASRSWTGWPLSASIPWIRFSPKALPSCRFWCWDFPTPRS